MATPVQVRAAWIAAGGTALAALIVAVAPVFNKTPQSVASALRAEDNSGTLIIGDNNVVGSHESSELLIQLRHRLKHQLSFSILSTGSDQFLVSRLYLRLHGFADCPLRNESTRLGAMAVLTSYSLYISPDFDVYELPTLAPPGEPAARKYKGSSDEFGVNLSYPNYTLFVVSVEAEGQHLATGRTVTAHSERMHLVDVANGNVGGCLNLEKWYDQDDLMQPPTRDYLATEVSALARQLLTVDLSQHRTYLDGIQTGILSEVLPELEGFVAQTLNPIFAENLASVHERLKH